ncbi:hypothetical protein FVE85_0985 [Porphyridium purpureum]|uniref:Uncharacterized protein n=1 Tax=Porphyridium purpureum TaxID=35688 RepID=A0A5J4Z0W9_PORPP|nr:hypothetical protein FVE85_0985 [Porphyridium purpureum]|eukprot:POR7868..scf208_2
MQQVAYALRPAPVTANDKLDVCDIRSISLANVRYFCSFGDQVEQMIQQDLFHHVDGRFTRPHCVTKAVHHPAQLLRKNPRQRLAARCPRHAAACTVRIFSSNEPFHIFTFCVWSGLGPRFVFSVRLLPDEQAVSLLYDKVRLFYKKTLFRVGAQVWRMCSEHTHTLARSLDSSISMPRSSLTMHGRPER